MSSPRRNGPDRVRHRSADRGDGGLPAPLPALLVDFSEASETTLDVTYAINTNWAANTAACYTQVAAGQELVPLLFLQSDD